MDSNLNPYSVFISYAHNDNESSDPNNRWLDRLLQFLQPLVEQNQVQAWSDTQIEMGENWEDKIQNALENTKAAVLLVSPAFLASKYICNSELPILLKNAKDRGTLILPIILRPSLFNDVKFKYPDPQRGPDEFALSSLQAANSPKKPMNSMTQFEQDEVLLSVAERLLKLVRQSNLLPEQTTGTNVPAPFNKAPSNSGQTPSNNPSQSLDKRALREILIESFNLQELEELCWEIQEELRKDGIDLQVSLEIVGGQGKRGRVLNLIQYLDRRTRLSYLVKGIRDARPGLI